VLFLSNISIFFTIPTNDLEKWEAIRRYILDKHGKFHGVIGHEIITHALHSIEESGPYAHKQIRHARSTDTHYSRLIMQFLEIDIVLKSEINEYIVRSIGFSKRTQKKYFQILKQRGIISFLETKVHPQTLKRIDYYSVNRKSIEIELKRLGLKLPVLVKPQTKIVKGVSI